MKYFTRELFDIVDGRVDYEGDSEALWKKAYVDYWGEFEKIKHRFSKEFLKVCKKTNHFHDDYIHSIEFKRNPKSRNTTLDVIVNVDVYEYVANYLYQLKHSNVTQYRFERQATNINDWTKCHKNHFDRWDFNELCYVDERTLSHEILFFSETTLYLEFKYLSIKKINN